MFHVEHGLIVKLRFEPFVDIKKPEQVPALIDDSINELNAFEHSGDTLA